MDSGMQDAEEELIVCKNCVVRRVGVALSRAIESMDGNSAVPVEECVGNRGSLGADSGKDGFPPGSVEVGTEEDASDFEDVARLTAEDICKMIFRSEERAFDFYSRFGKCYGLGFERVIT
ncbi:hypothetical protein PIB30_024255 [Stylosanthes scabra]|uniref:Uncharacterized protein n=1 Tax=Stylosanthes scabra TaxID=79078 RepID=A0ABU6UA16_9FABA|nr:hypothetical protein [Stylosanthes scabra]